MRIKNKQYKVNMKALISLLLGIFVLLAVIYFMPRYQYNQQFYDFIHPAQGPKVNQ